MLHVVVVLLFAVGCLAFYSLIVYVKFFTKSKSIANCKTVLFIIAHPDDECMFFGPTILQLCKDAEVLLLCLSAGDHYNQGKIRKEELRKSCKILGIPSGNITVIQHSKMQDDPHHMWREDLVGGIILKYILRLSADTVITFDECGVSGHINHISIYNGIKYLKEEGLLPEGCRVFILETVNILRKYASFFDIPLSYLFAHYAFVSSYRGMYLIQKSMVAHYSQLVWFRKLYIMFSRYVIINTFREIATSQRQACKKIM